jgi:hypothetical protein
LEVCVIQDVECFGTNLKSQRLAEFESFEDRDIGCPISWPDESVTSEIASRVSEQGSE